ncbi:MAG: hypothetical protein NC548_10830 [Lachnospiraceae bacterium]|nr:hypothetical protein [Lachnospiraceae bacterium]
MSSKFNFNTEFINGNSKTVPISELDSGVKRAVEILINGRPSDTRTSIKYFPCRQMNTTYSGSIINIDCTDYAIQDPLGIYLGVIHVYSVPARIADKLRSNISYVDIFVTVDRDAFVYVDSTTMSLIHVECNISRVTKSDILVYDMFTTDIDWFIENYGSTVSKINWEEFREQTSPDYDFEEKD